MAEEARDAVVIPIGTGGRPGRGSGSARPSSAARNLAPSAKKPAVKPAVRPAAKKASAKKRPSGGGPATEVPRVKVADAPPFQDPAASGGPATVGAGEKVAGPPPRTGIPVGDWLAAAQGAAKDVFGDDWERRLAELMAFVRRRLEGDYEVDDYGFDRELTERFFMAALRPVAEKWFRLEVRGLENIPAEGGALVVSNHSGTVPLDGLMTMLAVHDNAHRFLRPLGADLVFKMPVVSSLARKGGATLACTEDAERMLSGGDLVGVWPEGFKGIGKPFSERYKLQRFGRGGFVSAALRTGVPIIPLSVVGAEEIYPLVGNVPSLARLLGVPYIPITPFFPWLGPLGMVPLPSKWILEFGEPIRTDSYDAAEAEDPMLVFNVTDQVRETIQHTLFDLLRERDGVFS
ncbi:1-acyl-sn-glycerol-3-phosphate acyltransferase [Nocardioides alpinus]|uniref:1-acyl-sn-glycerol-3-phosphate acyltransferase n=2 Tax=Nocardioides alpinus TaxID=748909 RepID=A0A1I1AQU4_9ACTN|nr:lysophospholipid acyltransferase family protein [Nocardioides alpinus]SFB40401.1 1-acyl-sn-glycerol-3-phosphate acyltransferase [Nocardioides alpinus]